MYFSFYVSHIHFILGIMYSALLADTLVGEDANSAAEGGGLLVLRQEGQIESIFKSELRVCVCVCVCVYGGCVCVYIYGYICTHIPNGM